MMDLKNIQRVYFIGIGGIGMSVLARYFNEKKIKVSGYDRSCTAFTHQLETEGINIHYEENLSLIDQSAELVIFTPAIPGDHKELLYYQNHNYALAKRSEVLQKIIAPYYTIAVAGTHGKTTTSAMIAHILQHSGKGCNAFLGGISVNYNTNFWSSSENIAVVEADEYDRSFLKLNPDIAVLTAMDPDHLDIYKTADAMEDAFIQFTKNIKPGGTLIYKKGLHRSDEFKADHFIQYHLQDTTADVHAKNIRQQNGGHVFDVSYKNEITTNITLNMGGLHNVENAVAAFTAAYQKGIDPGKIKDAFADFKGVKRRFEYIIKNDRLVYIDDYAHHPEELRALISGAKLLFPDKKCSIIFQPHLFSRTKDFADEFAAGLSLAGEIILLPIYPARELPVAGITSNIIGEKIKNVPVKYLQKNEIINWIIQQPAALLLTAGAGDIDQLAPLIKNNLMMKYHA